MEVSEGISVCTYKDTVRWTSNKCLISTFGHITGRSRKELHKTKYQQITDVSTLTWPVKVQRSARYNKVVLQGIIYSKPVSWWWRSCESTHQQFRPPSCLAHTCSREHDGILHQPCLIITRKFPPQGKQSCCLFYTTLQRPSVQKAPETN
jgi:hypothetical protein